MVESRPGHGSVFGVGYRQSAAPARMELPKPCRLPPASMAPSSSSSTTTGRAVRRHGTALPPAVGLPRGQRIGRGGAACAPGPLAEPDLIVTDYRPRDANRAWLPYAGFGSTRCRTFPRWSRRATCSSPIRRPVVRRRGRDAQAGELRAGSEPLRSSSLREDRRRRERGGGQVKVRPILRRDNNGPLRVVTL